MTLDHLYLRFFDEETLVDTPDEALDFLRAQPEIEVDDYLENDLRQYYESKMPYPKRYKVRQRCYFIVIKTNAKSLEEFKNNATTKNEQIEKKEKKVVSFDDFMPGWYDVSLNFKRVVVHPVTGKCQYFDTDFRVRMKGESQQDCYDRVLDHLRNRFDVDQRSQFPSIKGKNFNAHYLGMK